MWVFIVDVSLYQVRKVVDVLECPINESTFVGEV